MQNIQTSNVRITDTALSKTHSGLREGSVVIGKVLENNGKNLIISLAGQQISVKNNSSNAALAPGMIFRGKILLKGTGENQKVELALLKDDVLQDNEVSKQNLVVQKLLNLGLTPSYETLKLVNFMMLMEMKLEGQRIKNALLKAEKGTSDEKTSEKAEIILLGDEKGLDFEKVDFDLAESNSQGNQQEKGALENKIEILKDILKKDVSPEEKNLAKKFADSINFASQFHKNGVLSLFNTLTVKKYRDGTEKKDFKHWFNFPFIWNFDNYKGTIKILQKMPEKVTEKIVISMHNEKKIHDFEIDFENGKVKNIKTEKWGSDERSFEDQLDGLFEKFKGCSIEI